VGVEEYHLFGEEKNALEEGLVEEVEEYLGA
jgi:hypothetical protein